MASILKFAAPILGLSAACAVCCSGPIVGSMVWAVGLAGLGTAWLSWEVGLVLLATLSLSALLYRSLKTHASSCTSTACQGECEASCVAPVRQS